MDPRDKQLIEETLRLSQENNKMLKSMRRSLRLSQILRVIYWIIIFGAAVGAFYYIQPYLDQIISVYGGIQTGAQQIQDFFQ